MLERMGWTSGKGLGKDEQGNTEHVAVKHKDDNKGVGFQVIKASLATVMTALPRTGAKKIHLQWG